MKTTDPSSAKPGHLILFRSLSIVLVFLLVVSCKKKGEDSWRILEDGIVGTWILKEAVFRNQIDLDGPGSRLPTTDARTLLYDMLLVYDNCSSVEEMSFELSDDPPEFVNFLFPEGKAGYAVCPQGFGITAWVFDYQFYDNSSIGYDPLLVLYKEEFSDPGNLFDMESLVLYLNITGEDTEDGKYRITGYCDDALITKFPDYNPDMTFDFVLERVAPN